MIAIPIGPAEKIAVVCSPEYIETRSTPQVPSDLLDHECINRRMMTDGPMLWLFEKGSNTQRIRVPGRLSFNQPQMILLAALEGIGIAYFLDSQVVHQLAAGTLVRVLPEWSPTVSGYKIFYPSRNGKSLALKALIDEINYNKF